MKLPINLIVPITIAALAWHFCVSAQVEHKPLDIALIAAAHCDERSPERLAKSNRSRTSVLLSPDGLYRAYAESEAVPFRVPNSASAECRNTSKLFVWDSKSQKFRPVLVVEPSPEADGNGIALVDWSPNGHRLLLAQYFSHYGSEVSGMTLRVYDAESENLSRKFLVEEAFRKHLGKHCSGVFDPVGFSSSGKLVVTVEPLLDLGEDKVVEGSCVQKEGFWLVDIAIPAVSQLPDNYRVERYGKVALESPAQKGELSPR